MEGNEGFELEPERPTGDELIINQGIAEALNTDEPIDDITARVIASRWHGGQGSLLYTFESTGEIDLEGVTQELLLDFRDEARTFMEREELDYLAQYLIANGDREAVEGWHEATKWPRANT